MSLQSDRYPRLATPIDLGTMRLRNRTAVSPMSTYGMAESDGVVSDRLIAYYESRARGGFGLVTTEATLVHPSGRSWPHHLAIFEDRCIPGLERLASAIKRHGAAAAVELHHGGAFASATLTGQQPMAASAQPAFGRDEVPRSMTISEIHEIEEAFATSARRAREAGFDAVELHMGTVYLILSFISPAQNHRTDEYGGDFDGRMRFPVRIIERIRELVGSDFPVGARIVSTDYHKGGIDLDGCVRVARRLEAAGVTYLDVTTALGPRGTRESPLSMGSPEAVLAEAAESVRRVVSVPVISVGRYLSMASAEEVVAAGKADIIAFGRASLADPAIVAKSFGGDEAGVIPCIACDTCFDIGYAGLGTSCLVDPETGHEGELQLIPASSPRTVLVRGAGLPGLEFARVAAMRGHDVTVATAGLPFGGLLGLRARVPGAAEIAKAVHYYGRRLDALGVNVVDDVQSTSDVVVDAGPGEFVVPEVPGLDPARAISAVDLLSGTIDPEVIGRHVVVIGRGLLGGETSLLLATTGKQVTFVSDQAALRESGRSSVAARTGMHMADLGVRSLMNAVPIRMDDVGLRVNAGPAVETISPVDSVVVAMGWLPAKDPGDEGGVARSDAPAHLVAPDHWDPFDLALAMASATRAAREL